MQEPAGSRRRVEVDLATLRRDEIVAAAHVAAQALRDNPTHLAIYGDDPAHRVRGLEVMIRLALMAGRHPVLAARHAGTLVGVTAMLPPGARLTPSLLQQLRMLPALLALGTPVIARLTRYGQEWSHHAPREPHWHIGPVAVTPDLQGQGIGSTMMATLCLRLDEAGDVAYLETDKPENVAFYQKFGFTTINEAPLLDVQCWFMRREPR